MRLRLWTIAAAACAVVVALHLPWLALPVRSYFQGQGGPTLGLQNLFSGGPLRVTGADATSGSVAGLLAATTLALSLAALATRNLGAAVSAALGAAATAWAVAGVLVDLLAHRAGLVVAYGLVVAAVSAGALAAVAVSVAAGRRPLAQVARIVPALVLGGSLLAPWNAHGVFEAAGYGGWSAAYGISRAPGALAGVAALAAAGGVWPRRSALAAAVFGVATFVGADYGGAHEPSAWIGLAAAIALVPPAVVGADFASIRVPPLVLAAALAVVGGLFLPWESTCYGQDPSAGSLAGRCVGVHEWDTVGTTIAALALLALFSALPLVEAAAAAALLAVTSGFRLDVAFEPATHVRAGVVVVYAGVALLVVAALREVRPAGVRVAGAAGAAIAAATAGLFVVPWWGVLPLGAEAALLIGPTTWFAVVAVVGAVVLAGAWLRATDAGDGASARVWLAVVFLLAAGLAVVQPDRWWIDWGGGAAVACAAVALALARVEELGGFRSLTVPEILRIDRI